MDDEDTPMTWHESLMFWAVVGSPFAAVLAGLLIGSWLT